MHHDDTNRSNMLVTPTSPAQSRIGAVEGFIASTGLSVLGALTFFAFPENDNQRYIALAVSVICGTIAVGFLGSLASRVIGRPVNSFRSIAIAFIVLFIANRVAHPLRAVAQERQQLGQAHTIASIQSESQREFASAESVEDVQKASRHLIDRAAEELSGPDQLAFKVMQDVANIAAQTNAQKIAALDKFEALGGLNPLTFTTADDLKERIEMIELSTQLSEQMIMAAINIEHGLDQACDRHKVPDALRAEIKKSLTQNKDTNRATIALLRADTEILRALEAVGRHLHKNFDQIRINPITGEAYFEDPATNGKLLTMLATLEAHAQFYLIAEERLLSEQKATLRTPESTSGPGPSW